METFTRHLWIWLECLLAHRQHFPPIGRRNSFFSRGSLARDVGEKWPRPGPQPTLFSSSEIASFTRHGDRYENKYKFTECFFFGSLSLWRQLKNNSTNCTNKKNERTEHTSGVQMKGKHFFIPVPIRSRLSERWTINTEQMRSKNVIIDSSKYIHTTNVRPTTPPQLTDVASFTLFISFNKTTLAQFSVPCSCLSRETVSAMFPKAEKKTRARENGPSSRLDLWTWTRKVPAFTRYVG